MDHENSPKVRYVKNINIGFAGRSLFSFQSVKLESTSQNYRKFSSRIHENDDVVQSNEECLQNLKEGVRQESEFQMYSIENESFESIYYDAHSLDYNVNSTKIEELPETRKSPEQDRIQLIQFNNILNEDLIDIKTNVENNLNDNKICSISYVNANSNESTFMNEIENNTSVQSTVDEYKCNEIYENYPKEFINDSSWTNGDINLTKITKGNEDTALEQSPNTHASIVEDSESVDFIINNSLSNNDINSTCTTYDNEDLELETTPINIVIKEDMLESIVEKFESAFYILDDIKDIVSQFADEFDDDFSNVTETMIGENTENDIQSSGFHENYSLEHTIGEISSRELTNSSYISDSEENPDLQQDKSNKGMKNTKELVIRGEDLASVVGKFTCVFDVIDNMYDILSDDDGFEDVHSDIGEISKCEPSTELKSAEYEESKDNSEDLSGSNITETKIDVVEVITLENNISDDKESKDMVIKEHRVISIVEMFDSTFSIIDEIKALLFDVYVSGEEETGFVETLTPQYTPGQSITSPQPVASAVEDKLANLQAQQEITQLKTEVEDLKEKLETLKVKRAEDREKLREVERVRLQLEQANEFKAKIMESQAQLQRDLQRAKQETREAQEALEQHQEETAELHEATEMAALDKEMAEERAEALQMELEQCREKLEEATLDLQLMKAEMEAGGNSQHPYAAAGGGYEMRQLEQQNARLRETLLRLRDLSAHDKHQLQRTHKDLEQAKSEVAELSRTKEKLSQRIEELEEQVGDLQEQVDAALGAEEMLSQLADKKMELEDQVEHLKQDVSELEALQEVHEQLVESDRELQLDLREELELAHAAAREAAREREAALETLLDRDATIVKFRELVQRLGEQCSELRAAADKQDSITSPAPEPRPVEVPTVAEWRGATRSIDLQLRALELRQATARAEILAQALPDHYMKSEGDHDAILMILLLQRMDTKAEIILGQIRERFPAPAAGREPGPHAAAQYSFRCQLEHRLRMTQCLVAMWAETLDSCSPELLLRAASALPDAIQQEKALDAALQLLKSNELDENCQLDGIERCWTYLAAMWATVGGGPAALSRCAVTHAVGALEALARGLSTDAAAIASVTQPSEQVDESTDILELVRSSGEGLQNMLKSIRRRIPPGAQLAAAGLDEQLIARLRGECSSALAQASRCAWLAARAAAADPAPAAAPPAQIWRAACNLVYRQEEPPLKTLKQALSLASGDISRLATFVQEREYDMMSTTNVPSEKPIPPVVLRAQLVKKQLEETKTLTIRLENKEADIKELKKLLKATKEELSEMQIRRELGERKLAGAARDAELKAEQLQRRLDDASNALRRKEKEFEETMDHLQKDIDSLETERGALRDKLKVYAKRGSTHIEDPTPVKAAVGSGVVSGEANEALQHQLKVLSWTVERERSARIAACKRAERAAVLRLRPLQSPAAAAARRAAANTLQLQLNKLQTEWTLFVARSGLVSFPEDPAKYARALQVHREKQREVRRQLEERLLALQAEVKSQLMQHRPWRCVETHLASFPTPELARALQPKSVDIGTIQFPASADLANDDTIYVTPAQLAKLRELVSELRSDDVKLDLKPLDTVCAA